MRLVCPLRGATWIEHVLLSASDLSYAHNLLPADWPADTGRSIQAKLNHLCNNRVECETQDK